MSDNPSKSKKPSVENETAEDYFKLVFGIPKDAILMGGSDLVLKDPIEENVEDYIGSVMFYIHSFLEKSSNNNELISALNSTYKEEFEARLKNTLHDLENKKHYLLTTITDGENTNQLNLKESAFNKLCSFQEELLKLAIDEKVEIIKEDNIELQKFYNLINRKLKINADTIKNDLSDTAIVIKKKYAHRPISPVDEYPKHFTSKEAFFVFKDFNENHVNKFWPDQGVLYHRLKANCLIKEYSQRKWFEILTEELLTLDDGNLTEIKKSNSDWATHYFGSERNLNYGVRSDNFKKSFKKYFPEKECFLYPKG